MTGRRIPATASTNQGLGKGDLIDIDTWQAPTSMARETKGSDPRQNAVTPGGSNRIF